MSSPGSYSDWYALQQAIKTAVQHEPDSHGQPPSKRLDSAIHDRFLTRVFLGASEDSEWLLKGGRGMLARVPDARSTQDVDLAAGPQSLDDAVRSLQQRASADLGDHLTFELEKIRETGLGDVQPSARTRQVTFVCRAGGKIRSRVKVDIVVAPAPTGRVEIIEPADRLTLSKPLQTAKYRLFPVVDQIAEKVCATMTVYPGGRRSSRTKDLVDIVVLARSQRIDLRELQIAIATQQIRTRLTHFDTLDIPQEWEKPYAALARSTPAVGEITTLSRARELTHSFVDPALSATPITTDQQWTPAPQRQDNDHDGKSVHIEAYTRGTGPVVGHWRSPRS